MELPAIVKMQGFDGKMTYFYKCLKTWRSAK